MKFLSQITTATSGSVNGLTASHNRGGRYFRARVVPTNPNTTRQIATRGFFTTAATQWPGLSSAQQAAWALFAANVTVTNALGSAVVLTAQQWWIGAQAFNLDLLDAGANVNPTVTAPTTFNRGEISIGTTTLGIAAGLSMALTGDFETTGGEDHGIAIYQGRPQGTGVNFYKGPWRRAFASTNGGFTSPATVATAALPYAITLGQRVWFQVRALTDDGRLSSPVIAGPFTVTS